mmetsp:Transcript_25214/g.75918  ORF Transcript_25214/g.75918 Transcript_25214/m.75918 type:complete len:259 (+) Transcript_25214:376-1152(+)
MARIAASEKERASRYLNTDVASSDCSTSKRVWPQTPWEMRTGSSFATPITFGAVHRASSTCGIASGPKRTRASSRTIHSTPGSSGRTLRYKSLPISPRMHVTRRLPVLFSRLKAFLQSITVTNCGNWHSPWFTQWMWAVVGSGVPTMFSTRANSHDNLRCFAAKYATVLHTCAMQDLSGGAADGTRFSRRARNWATGRGLETIVAPRLASTTKILTSPIVTTAAPLLCRRTYSRATVVKGESRTKESTLKPRSDSQVS